MSFNSKGNKLKKLKYVMWITISFILLISCALLVILNQPNSGETPMEKGWSR